MPHLSSTECVEPSSSGDEVMEGDEERGDDCSSMLDESISISDIRQAQQGEEIVLLSPPFLFPFSSLSPPFLTLVVLPTIYHWWQLLKQWMGVSRVCYQAS